MPAFLVRFTQLDTHRTGSTLVCSTDAKMAVSTFYATRTRVLADRVELASADRVLKSLSPAQRAAVSQLALDERSWARVARGTRQTLERYGLAVGGALTILGERVADILEARRMLAAYQARVEADGLAVTGSVADKMTELYDRASL